jgi:hypothetical protein
MNYYIKNKLIQLGFKEEIDFIPYKISYNYSYNLIINKYTEYNIIIKCFSNQYFEILKIVKNNTKNSQSYTIDFCFKGKISSINNTQLFYKIIIEIGINEILNLSNSIQCYKS